MARTALLAVLSVVGFVGCGGDGGADSGDGSRGAVAEEEASIELDPRAGPPGTRIEWTLSGCEEESEKSVILLTRQEARKGYSGWLADATATVPEGSSGTLVVPTSVTNGPLTVAASCASKESQREPPFEMEVVEAQFALTGG